MWNAFGRRELDTEHLDIKSQAFEIWYRDIDLNKGTARDLARVPADLTVKIDRDGALWLLQTSSSDWAGIEVTTIVPIYAASSHDFIVIQSLHSWVGKTFAAGHQYSGTCSVMD